MAEKSPPKKKVKVNAPSPRKHFEKKHLYDDCQVSNTPSKKQKLSEGLSREDEDLATKRRLNFITACEKVSCDNFFDYRNRFLLQVLPSCLNKTKCSHLELKEEKMLVMLPDYAREGFKIDYNTHMWCDALDVCRMTINYNQYVPCDLLQHIINIVLNAHDDQQAGYSIPYLLDCCQQTLSLAFMTHPPCMVLELRQTYKSFLLDPFIKNESSFSDAAKYEPQKGLVKYCMNRLEFEMSCDSPEGPIVDASENVPEEMKQTVKGLHWQKEKFEIFETLNRHERINRLMIVLESVVELLQLDSAIWHSRHKHNQGKYIMRSNKPILAYVLWSDNILYTGAVNSNCRQIIKLFIQVIHLNYPECSIRIFVRWLNLMVQMFYVCENNSQGDYPNAGKYSTSFASEFVKLLKNYSSESITKITERIQPSFMKYIIGNMLLKEIIDIKENDPLNLVLYILKARSWTAFDNEIHPKRKVVLDVKKPRYTRRLYSFFLKASRIKRESLPYKPKDIIVYPRFENDILINDISMEKFIKLVYIVLDAYVHAYSIDRVKELVANLNSNDDKDKRSSEDCSYRVSEDFVKRYRSIFQTLKEIIAILLELKKSDHDYNLKIFEKIPILELC